MSATDRAFDLRPEALKAVGVVNAVNVALLSVIDRAVGVANFVETVICAPFVGADGRILFHVANDVRLKRSLLRIRNNARHHIAAAFQHSENNRLAFRAAPGDAMRAPANIGFVKFNVTRERRIAVNARHMVTDQMRHAERGRIGDAKLALQFFRRNAVTRRGEQVDRVKPLRERCMAVLEHRADHRVDVVAAIAGVGGLLRQLPKLADFPAFRAGKVSPETKFKKVGNAGFVGRKTLEKVLNCQCLGHIGLSLCSEYRVSAHICQLYNRVFEINSQKAGSAAGQPERPQDWRAHRADEGIARGGAAESAKNKSHVGGAAGLLGFGGK